MLWVRGHHRGQPYGRTHGPGEKREGSPTMLFRRWRRRECRLSTRAPTVVRWGAKGADAFRALTDEFNGNELDGKKWSTDQSWWAVSRDFSAANVRVENGTLKLFAREAHRNASWPEDWRFDRRYSLTCAYIAGVLIKSDLEVHQYRARLVPPRWEGFVDRDWRVWSIGETHHRAGWTRPMCTHTHVFELASSTRGHSRRRLHFRRPRGEEMEEQRRRKSNPAPLGPACQWSGDSTWLSRVRPWWTTRAS